MFFWFNAGAIGCIALSNILFDGFGGHWVILPLVWVAGFATHALTVHLYWTIRRNTYSPACSRAHFISSSFISRSDAASAAILLAATILSLAQR
jgi:hypothetical protein